VSFTHIEDSGYYDCRVVDNDDNYIQFHVVVNANCESNETCSSENSFSSINPTIDVSTTTSSISPELLQQEILQRIKLKESGDGLMADQPSKGVCCNKCVVVWCFPFLYPFFVSIEVYGSLRCLFTTTSIQTLSAT
jgi:hypothetical protein